MTITLADIRRYPVKGMNGTALDSAALEAGRGLPHDRRFALAPASSGVSRSDPKWMPKNHFLNLSRDERLAQLAVDFDPASNRLTVARGGRQVAAGDPTTPLGRNMLEQFFAGFFAAGARGNPKLVEAASTPFADSPEPFLSLVNLTSVADIERVARQPTDRDRFRANLYFDGAERWEERDWVGREVRIGSARLRVEAPIERCGATNVDPATAARDMNIPLVLERGFGHTECGVYATVLDGGTIGVGDPLEWLR